MRVLKESFNAGEFTPRLHSRYELAKFKNGCKTLTNFIPLAHGPVTRRPGTEYIAAVKTASKYTRLIPFEFSEEDAYVVEFGDLYCRFYRNGGQIQTVDANTVLLLHFDGINNSTTITDYGTTGHAMTANGDAKLKTEQKRFGLASCYFDQTGDFISASDHADFNFSTADFTIDAWVRFPNIDSTEGYGIYGQYDDANNYIGFWWIGSTTQELRFWIKNAGDTVINLTGTFAPVVDTWYHVAIIRGWGGDSDVFALTVNGAAIATDSYDASDTAPDLSGDIWIGKWQYAAGTIGEFLGYIDEPRVSTVARWTATFSPPTSQYPFGDDTGTTYEIITTYVEADLPYLQFVQSADTMYIVHENYVVRKLVRSDHANWAISNVTFTNQPLEWSAGDYPRTIEFYEDRLVFGGSPDQPDTIWTSDVGDYTSFTSTTEYTASTIALVDSNPDTITDSANGFVTNGFVAGMPITLTGCATAANDASYTIATVAAGTITLIAQDAINTAEAAGASITISGGNAADDEAITLTLLARKVNDIQWLSAGRKLLIGTRGEEWWASGPSDTEPITPSDHVARKDSAWGSKAIMPVDIGDVVFYVQQGGRVVREMIYDYSKDKYVSTDMNVLAEHLTKNYSIIAMAYQQHPNQILWCVRSDGSVIALTYLKEHDVYGWSLHTFASGQVESIAVISGDPEDEVWFSIKRTVNSSVVRYVERLKVFNYGTVEDAFFMDCGLTYDGADATTISGLSHLEGEAVTVLADGAVVTGKTVSSGAITLTTAAGKVHVGLANTPEFETLDVVASDNRVVSSGPLMGVIKRITNISLRLVNSMGGLYGPDSSTTDSIPYRDTSSLFTGWTEDISFDEGFDETSTVYLTCDEPLPMEIAAILIDLEDD